MIRIFKSVDEKLSDIGFTKVKDDEYGVDYERLMNTDSYIKCPLDVRNPEDIYYNRTIQILI